MAISEPNTILEINEMHADNFILVIPNLPVAQYLGSGFSDFTKPGNITPGSSGTSGTNDNCPPVSLSQLRRESNLDLKNFMLYIQEFKTPTVSLNTYELGTKFASINRASKIKFGDLSTKMVVSENLINYNAILYWLYALHNPEEFNKLSGRDMINNFFVDIHLIVTNNHREKIAEYKFIDAFPFELDPLQLSHQNADKQFINVGWKHSGMVPENNFVLRYV